MSTSESSRPDGTSEPELARTAEGIVSESLPAVAFAQAELDEAEKRQLDWYHNVYQGDKVPQLTWRAVIMGAALGSLMSISNLYTMVKVGWCFGVAITACVLSYVIWNCLRTVFRGLSPMTILENNCMQSTASAAGYSTGATIGTAFGAYLLITGHQVSWHILLPWTLVSAALGVFLAVPMKRQMINQENLPFPDGVAAASTLRSLYSRSQESIRQAYSLITAMVTGAIVGLLRDGSSLMQRFFVQPLANVLQIPAAAYQWTTQVRLPELMAFPYKINDASFPSFGFEPSLLLMGAGMIIGLRVSASMLFGSVVLYVVVGPWLARTGGLESPTMLLKWSVWTGSAMMVTSGLTALALQWKTIARAFRGFGKGDSSSQLASLEEIEVPRKWFIAGLVPLIVVMALIQYVAFSIALPLGLLSVILSFFLALVAARSTGETNVTPIGAMGKISQLIFAVLSPANATTNLMTASVTANIASSSSDLLTDLKSGYLLGANPRRQFLAQLVGCFFGAISIVPAWYLMFPTAEKLDSYHPPSTYIYKAVAEALSHGISYIPETARWGLLIGAALGIIIAVLEQRYPKQRHLIPSAMGLGLSWVVSFSNAFAFFIGALTAAVWLRVHKQTAESLTIPIASGAIAGESLACAFIAITDAASVLIHK